MGERAGGDRDRELCDPDRDSLPDCLRLTTLPALSPLSVGNLDNSNCQLRRWPVLVLKIPIILAMAFVRINCFLLFFHTVNALLCETWREAIPGKKGKRGKSESVGRNDNIAWNSSRRVSRLSDRWRGCGKRRKGTVVGVGWAMKGKRDVRSPRQPTHAAHTA